MHPLPDSVATLLQETEGALLLSDASGIIVFANAAAGALFGYEPDELVGEAVEILVPEARRARHARLREQYKDRPRARPLVSGLELTARRRNGSRFRAEISLAPIHTNSGMLVASTIREVRDTPSVSDFFRTILESAPDAMIIADHAGAIAVVNGRSEELFGYGRDELVGNPVEMLLPQELRDRHEQHRADFARNPAVRMMGAGLTLSARHKDGSEFPVEISLSPVIASGSHYVFTVIRDITERKELEDEIVAARREAERANKANTAFLAAASHDLRQPVQALTLLNGALRRAVADEKALGLIDSQQQSLQAMTNLLNSLLDISRLDAGAVKPEFETFPVQRLFDRLASEFGRQAGQKGLTFSARPCAALVHSDANLLSEIIQNFVSNALRYTGSGRVELSGDVDDGLCRITVSDTGIGIEADQLERIFDEFHQAGRKRNEGFGLGLAIVRRLADLLEHPVSVESTPGRGSSFAVTVPVVAPDGKSHAPVTVSARPVSGSGSGLIMVIEDDVAVSAAMRLVLESDGFRVHVSASADDLQAALASTDEVPVLVISDFHIGADGATGADLIRRIRLHFGRDVPAFIISGDTSRIVDAAKDIRNCVLMNKPVDSDRLLEAVARAVGDPPDRG